MFIWNGQEIPLYKFFQKNTNFVDVHLCSRDCRYLRRAVEIVMMVIYANAESGWDGMEELNNVEGGPWSKALMKHGCINLCSLCKLQLWLLERATKKEPEKDRWMPASMACIRWLVSQRFYTLSLSDQFLILQKKPTWKYSCFEHLGCNFGYFIDDLD